MKPELVTALAILAAGLVSDAPAADWKATGVDDQGHFEYRVKESPVNPDKATIEYYHYGTGERSTTWLKREHDDTYLERYSRDNRRWSRE